MSDARPRPVLWMVCGAFSFATMSALTHSLGGRCDWLLVAFARIFVMFLASTLLAKASGVRLPVWSPRTLWVRSLSGTLSLFCTFYALSRLPVADVLTMTNTYPLWIVLFSWWEQRRALGPSDVLGVVCGIVGVALIQRPQLSHDRLATFIALGASFWAAIAMMGLHRLRDVDPKAVVAHFSAVGSIVTAAWLVRRGDWNPSAWATPSTLALLIGVGLAGTVGQIYLTKAYAAGVPSKIAAVSPIQVGFGLIYDLALWGRHLTPLTLLGFVLVLCPTAWISRRAAIRFEEIGAPAGTLAHVDDPVAS